MDLDFIDEELKEKIANTKFRYIVARAATGKTFTGDYLEAIRGWKHVDGDEPAKTLSINPEWTDAVDRLFGAGKYEEPKKKDPLAFHLNPENYQPYFSIVARLTLEAARESSTVVVSHATYVLDQRNFFRQCLVDAGATDVETVFLYSDPDKHAEALWSRCHRQAEQSGVSVQTILIMWGVERPLEDLEAFKKWFMDESVVYSHFMPEDEKEQPYVIVNNTAKDATVLDRVDEVFGIEKDLSRGEGTYEEMIEKIKAVDAARDLLWLEEKYKEVEEQTGDEEAEALKELIEKEPAKVRARRSSLIDVQKIESARHLSAGGTGRRSSAAITSVAAAAKFLRLGKVDDETEE